MMQWMWSISFQLTNGLLTVSSLSSPPSPIHLFLSSHLDTILSHLPSFHFCHGSFSFSVRSQPNSIFPCLHCLHVIWSATALLVLHFCLELLEQTSVVFWCESISQLCRSKISTQTGLQLKRIKHVLVDAQKDANFPAKGQSENWVNLDSKQAPPEIRDNHRTPWLPQFDDSNRPMPMLHGSFRVTVEHSLAGLPYVFLQWATR